MKTGFIALLTIVTLNSLANAQENCRNGAAAYALREYVISEYIEGYQIGNTGFVTTAYLVHSILPEAADPRNPYQEVYNVIVHKKKYDQKTGASSILGGEVYKTTMFDNGGATCELRNIERVK